MTRKATPPDQRRQFNLQFVDNAQYQRARELVATAKTLLADDVEDAAGIRLQISNPAIVLAALEEFVRARTEAVL